MIDGGDGEICGHPNPRLIYGTLWTMTLHEMRYLQILELYHCLKITENFE